LFCLVELLNLIKIDVKSRRKAGPSNIIFGFKSRFGSKVINGKTNRYFYKGNFTAAGGLGFATYFWKVAKKIILKIL
jgi:hypothetical protein